MGKKGWVFVFALLMQQAVSAQPDPTADSVLRIMKKVADGQLRTWGKSGMRWAKTDWTNAACYTGYMAINSVANDPRYLDAMRSIGKAVSWNTGLQRTMADDYCIAQMFCAVYALDRDPRMIASFRALADSMVRLPHVESLEWKNEIQLREWAWCDALFMGPPALASLSTVTGDRKYLDLADTLWWKTTDYLYDPTEHLYTRDSRYLDQKEANGKKMFWSRGNGWVLAGLVRMLANMPEDYPDRPRYLRLFRDMSAKMASVQHRDGSWHTALLDSVSYPAKEVSGTGFFCYALAWGINQGILNPSSFLPVVLRAWHALEGSVHPDGALGNVQQIGEKPGAVDDNSREVYGTGAFLLAGTELTRLLLEKAPNPPFVQLTNPTGLNRKEELTEFSFDSCLVRVPGFLIPGTRIENALTGEEIPYQLEYRGEKSPLHLLVELNISPGSLIFLRAPDKAPSLPLTRTYARYVPERADDFAWENDRIAFRVYGKALEGTRENGYGIDVWVKRTDRMILNERYKRGEYHIDHGDGMDCYQVGNSLGAGNIAPFLQDSIWYSANYHRWKLLDNGPLRSSFILEYDAWNVAGMPVRVNKLISLDAGSQLSRIEAGFSWPGKQSLPLVVGIVKRKEAGEEWFDEQDGILGYWEPGQGEKGVTGLGAVFPQASASMSLQKGHLLAQVWADPGRPIIYYTGACWDKAGLFMDAGAWFDYLKEFRERLSRPLIVRWRPENIRQ
jgi:unsaturated rhamnogalacturonyl hydrolase